MNQKTMQVLLVEDNPADATLVRQAFSRFSQEKWQFLGVETLDEAIRAYRLTADDMGNSPFDLVLLDLGLPDAKGLETVQQFLAASPEALVVVLSGMDDVELALQAIEQGAQDYLVKDKITVQILLKSVRFAIRRQHTLRQLQQSVYVTQQALNQSEEINQQQICFVGMVSHEIRNPLGVIQMSTELLQYSLEGAMNTKVQKWLGKIQIANEQVLYLLNDVLTLCQLPPENLTGKFTDVRLHKFFADLVDEIRQTSSQKHPIEVTIQKELSHTFTDIQLVRSIFTNLVSNAIKYTPQGGIIRLSVTMQDCWITFLVQDFGIGIPEADQQHLFEHFYRASNVSNIAGTGLGLAIVKRCVTALQGKVEVESKVNLGTTFKVQLPLILSIPSGIDATRSPAVECPQRSPLPQVHHSPK
jgi:signal transduction histidine kinase